MTVWALGLTACAACASPGSPQTRAHPAAAGTPGRAQVEGILRIIDDTPDRQLEPASLAGAEIHFVQDTFHATARARSTGAFQVSLPPGTYQLLVDTADGALREAGPGHWTATGRFGFAAPLRAPWLHVPAGASRVVLDLTPTVELTGTVRNTYGRPVVDAEVFVWSGPRGTDGAAVARTDAAGAYRLRVPDDGDAAILARHPTGVSIQNYLNLTRRKHGQADVHLSDGCIVRGRVTTPDGGAAGPGVIELPQRPGSFMPISRVDEDGGFGLTLLPGETMTVRARVWGAAPSSPQDLRCSDTDPATSIALVVREATPTHQGRVLDDTGRPVPYVPLLIDPDGDATRGYVDRTDAAGNWRVLEPGPVRVRALHPIRGWAEQTLSGAPRPTDLQLRRGRLAGRVTGLRQGTLRLDVRACDDRLDQTSWLVPVRDGRYEVSLPACVLDGHGSAGHESRPVQVRINAGEATVMDLDLSPPRIISVSGRIVGPDGEAIVGATVTSPLRAAEAITDDDGRFTILASEGDLLEALAPDGRFGRLDLASHPNPGILDWMLEPPIED